MIYKELISLFDSFLGDNKRGVTDNGQIQYNCPCCAYDSGKYGGDDKYNLEINFRLGKFRCWACDETNNMKGKISYLIDVHGNKEILNTYKEILLSIKNNKAYNFTSEDFANEDFGELLITLPNGCEKINKNNYKHKNAYDYLINDRGLTDEIINKHNLYCTNWCDDWKLRNRIIVPSYDKYGNLNYYSGRLYPDTNTFGTKYFNMRGEKKNLIFNERFIDWEGDVRLVEGPFDHLVVPNSIPLLGKTLNKDFILYHELFKKCQGTITIFLDSDALDYTKILYRTLNTDNLYNKIRYIPTPNNFDPSKIFKDYGYKGIIKTLKNNQKFNELDLFL